MFRPIFLLLASLAVVTGCATVNAPSNSIYGTAATPESVFDGVYKGEGLRIKMSGNSTFGFTAKLMAYSENGAIFLRETTSNAGGIEKSRTYRITQPEPNKYICTDIDYLRRCDLTVSGDTIIITAPIYDRFGSDDFLMNAVNIYQLMPDGTLIKRTTYNKYLFFFNQEEVIAYKKQ